MLPVGARYPVRVEARLDETLSRWRWLVKWLLIVPHLIVLVFLWIGFVVTSVAAFFAILVTGRYPRPLFDFNVGVLRWTWRVQYYSYAALGTDRYPPFTLAEVADYPAHFDVDYPDRLSRGLVLVKAWLLAIPQWVIVGILLGGRWSTDSRAVPTPGLIGFLTFCAGVALTFTGTYPRGLYAFVLGLNRWVLRVAAYAALMTDRYPPFRLDQGGAEPVGPIPAALPVPPVEHRWSAGRLVAVVAGAVLCVASLLPLAAGGVALGVDHVGRVDGYVTSGSAVFDTPGYAMTAGTIRFDDVSSGWLSPSQVLGSVRFRVTSLDPAVPVFVGIGPSDRVGKYLSGVELTRYTNLAGRHRAVEVSGGPPPGLPASSGAFAASASGRGTQALTWQARPGTWTVVVMRADATAGLVVRADAGAQLPHLSRLATVLLVTGGAVLLVGIGLIVAGALVAERPVRR
jgi:hypothetical protein